jgi:hypothetical protein
VPTGFGLQNAANGDVEVPRNRRMRSPPASGLPQCGYGGPSAKPPIGPAAIVSRCVVTGTLFPKVGRTSRPRRRQF